MPRTLIERVSGELVGAKATYKVDLNLTILETQSKGKSQRTIDDINPTTLSGVPDGDYTLRFPFDERQEEHAVRISFGFLLAR